MKTFLFVKRVFDIVFSLLGIIITLPILSLMTIVLLTQGERKPLFFQKRQGKNGRLFNIYKLRTISNPGKNLLTAGNENNITPFCKFLRISKIDEFPQFFNVLKGDLSFVGPRPLLPKIFHAYPLQMQQKIKKIKPGLTGVGSLTFRNENSFLKKIPQKDYMDFYYRHISPRKGALEYWYSLNQSFWTDCKILVLTPLIILLPKIGIPKNWFKNLPDAQLDLIPSVEEHEVYQLNSFNNVKTKKIV